MSLVTKAAQSEFLFMGHQSPVLSSWDETKMHFSVCRSGDSTNSGLLNIWSVLSLISHSHAALLSFNHYSSCPKNYLKTPLEIFFTTENQNKLFRIPGAQVNTSTVTPFPAGSLNALHMSYPIPVMVPSPCLSDTKSPHLAPHLIFFFMLLSL